MKLIFFDKTDSEAKMAVNKDESKGHVLRILFRECRLLMIQMRKPEDYLERMDQLRISYK